MVLGFQSPSRGEEPSIAQSEEVEVALKTILPKPYTGMLRRKHLTGGK